MITNCLTVVFVAVNLSVPKPRYRIPSTPGRLGLIAATSNRSRSVA